MAVRISRGDVEGVQNARFLNQGVCPFLRTQVILRSTWPRHDPRPPDPDEEGLNGFLCRLMCSKTGPLVAGSAARILRLGEVSLSLLQPVLIAIRHCCLTPSVSETMLTHSMRSLFPVLWIPGLPSVLKRILRLKIAETDTSMSDPCNEPCLMVRDYKIPESSLVL